MADTKAGSHDHDNDDDLVGGNIHHSSIPDSAEYIKESTLIPESSFSALENDADTIIPESSMESTLPTPQGEQPKANTPSSMKKNAPFIVVAVLAVLGGGAFMLKKGDSEQQQQVVVQAKPAPKPERAAPPPLTASMPDPVAQAPAQAPVQAEAAQAAQQAASSPPTNPTGSPIALPTPVAQSPAQPQTIVAKADTSRIDGELKQHGVDITDLQVRVTKLEEQPKAIVASGTSPKPGKSVKPVRSATAEKADKPKRQDARNGSAERRLADRNAEKLAKLEAHEKKQAAALAIDKMAASYTLHMVRDNLAWVRSSKDATNVYSIGDTIPGVGRLTKIDELNHQVTAGGRVIR